MSSTRTALTPADLLNLPRPNDGQHDELSDGELIVVSSAGARHELVKSRYMWALSACQLRYSTGGVFAESQFTPGEATARIPDVAFVQDAKLKLLPDADVPIPFGPDWQVSQGASRACSDCGRYPRAGFRRCFDYAGDARI
jgi:hypothetical protein